MFTLKKIKSNKYERLSMVTKNKLNTKLESKIINFNNQINYINFNIMNNI